MVKYIIYLHPSPKTPQYEQLRSFWKCARKTLPNNQALIYPFHATLTSFFTANEEELKQVKDEINRLFFWDNHISHKFVLNRGTLKTVRFSSISLSVKIFYLVHKFNFLKSRTINGLHFTLTHNIDEKDNLAYCNLINKYINTDLWRNDGWSVKLWKVSDDLKEWEIIG